MERPAKKPRRGPDGFQKSKSTAHYKPPESITKFVSAFDSAPSPKKPVSHDLPQNPFVAPVAKPSAQLAHPPRLTKSEKPLPPLRVLKPPVPLSSHTAQVESSSSRTARSLQPTEKPRSILKPPPVPIPSGTTPSAPLKPIAPPPPLPLHRPASPKRPMKTILTTSIAQATDPTKEGTGAELLSLFLQQHGHTFIAPTDRELQRGVMVSPDKRTRGKDPKFLRGGLAERIQHRISCTKTDFTLWKRQTEHKLEAGSKLGSDMQLHIMRVLDVGKVSEWPRFTQGPRAGLALCRLVRRHALTRGDLALGTYVVLFHFAPTQGGTSPVSSVDRFAEGNDVMVWLPWQKIELAKSAGLLDMCRALDTLTPPQNLLVVSRFCINATT